MPLLSIVLCLSFAAVLTAQAADAGVGANIKLAEQRGFTQTDIVFKHDNASLSGVLIQPSGDGPHPAVILIPGHGTRTSPLAANWRYLQWCGEYLAANGFVVLNYDRPGTGKSDGDWRHQTLYDRADEVLAALAFMKQQPNVDASRIGLIGHSNGGWVAPLTASLSPEVAFVVTLAGPAVSVYEQGAYAVHQKLAHTPLPEIAKQTAESMLKDFHTLTQLMLQGRRTEFNVVRARMAGRVESMAFLATLFKQPKPELPTWNDRTAVLQSMDAMIDYDPLPALRKVKCPLLAIFGGADQVVNSEESARLFEETLKSSGHEQCTIKIFPGADHGLEVNGRQPAELRPFLLEWVNRQTETRAEK